MTLSKETRAELRRRCPTPEETDALLDLADERDRYRALLREVLDDNGFVGYTIPITLNKIDAALEGEHIGPYPDRNAQEMARMKRDGELDEIGHGEVLAAPPPEGERQVRQAERANRPKDSSKGETAPHAPKQAEHKKRDSYLDLAGRIIEQRGGDNRSLDNALDSFNEVMADFHELTGIDPNANPKVGQIREALTFGGTPEQAHGDALQWLDSISNFIGSRSHGEKFLPGLKCIRRALTASGAPYVPEGLGYADITSPEYNGWINLLWGSDKFPVGMVPPPYSTQIKRALASAPADGYKLVPVEPTEEMWQAGHEEYERAMLSNRRNVTEAERRKWRAMIAAAPTDGRE